MTSHCIAVPRSFNMNSILNIFMKGDPSRCSPVLNLNHKYFLWIMLYRHYVKLLKMLMSYETHMVR